MARDKDIEVDDELSDEGSGPRVYELGFHLDPELPSEEVKKAYGAIKSAIEAHGTIIAEGEPEKVQLAYTISRQEPSGRRDFNSAYFSWIAYECDSSKHAEVLMAAKDPRIVRFIDLLTDKDTARHALEMRELRLKAPEPKDTERVPDDLDAALEEVGV